MTHQVRQGIRKERGLTEAIKASKAPAISRAAAILRLLARSDEPMRLQIIARTLGLVPSTCLYLLRALVAEEIVSFDQDTKRYALEVGVLTLARKWLSRDQFAGLVQRELDRINKTFDVTMLGIQIVGLDHIVVVASSESWSNFQVRVHVGSRFPALVSATGRCVAAFGDYSENELKKRFKALRWDKPPSFNQWKKQVEEVRAHGFAVDAGNYIAGVTVFAAPVWKTREKFSHAIVAISIESALQRNDTLKLQSELLAAAQKVSSQLGGHAFVNED